MQEAFTSLEPESGLAMVKLIQKILPDSAMLTITNQPAIEALHERRIILGST